MDLQGVPSHADVLSHYAVAIWYTGDDYAPTVPNGFATHAEESIAFRDYLNYSNGKLFATGQDLAWISAVYGAFDEIPDDFFQYYLGAFMDIDTGGIDAITGQPYDVMGEAGDPVFDGLNFGIQGGDGAATNAAPARFWPPAIFYPISKITSPPATTVPVGRLIPIPGITMFTARWPTFRLEDFESGLGDWTVSVAPGSGAFNNWVRITGAGFPEGPAMRTADSVYLGFGFEAISTADDRNRVMDRVMRYLLPNP